MKEKTVVFIGHNDIMDLDYGLLEKEIIGLIESGYNKFFSGGMGGFDRTASGIIYKLKRKYPYIKNVLVIPYINFNIYDKSVFDEIIIPEKIEGLPYKASIIHRNRYMVDNSCVALCYIRYTFGGASKTFEYAKKKEIRIILV